MMDLPDKIIRKKESPQPLDFGAQLPKALEKCTMLILELRKMEMEECTIVEVRLDQPQPIEVLTETYFNKACFLNINIFYIYLLPVFYEKKMNFILNTITDYIYLILINFK